MWSLGGGYRFLGSQPSFARVVRDPPSKGSSSSAFADMLVTSSRIPCDPSVMKCLPRERSNIVFHIDLEPGRGDHASVGLNLGSTMLYISRILSCISRILRTSKRSFRGAHGFKKPFRAAFVDGSAKGCLGLTGHPQLYFLGLLWGECWAC